MLKAAYLSVMQARTRTELRDEVVRFAKGAGFDYVSATVVIDHAGGDTEFISVHNTPEGYLVAFFDVQAGRRDPVMQHCKKQSVPIIWDQLTYARACAGELWEEQAPFGFKTGVALALHLPQGRHFMLGVDRDERTTAEVDISRVVADLLLFAVCANEVASRILVPFEKDAAPSPPLTPREIECLSWTMEGKTAWEAGAILGLAESTVVYYLRNAVRKLKCVNKQQAVVRALRLGLIR